MLNLEISMGGFRTILGATISALIKFSKDPGVGAADSSAPLPEAKNHEAVWLKSVMYGAQS